MRDLEQLRGLGRVGRRVERASGRRSFDGDARPPERQEVEIELARAPAPSLPAPERALERLERDQDGQRARLGVETARDFECDDSVAELRLVGHADRRRGIEPGDAAEPSPGKRRQRANGLDEDRLGIADVRPKADVGADPSLGHVASIRDRVTAGARMPR